MAGHGSTGFYAGDWRVDPDAGRITRADVTHTLRPREVDLLVYLAERAGEVVRTDDIMRDVWSGVEVTNDSLYFSISQLRKVLDDRSSPRSLIETIPKRGYRLAAPVRPVDAESPAAELPAAHNNDPGLGLPPPSPKYPRHYLATAAAVVVVAALAWFVTRSGEPPPVDAGSAAALTKTDASSIAVMPFIDLTPEADYTYFSDGITEEILNRLTRVPGLRVAARTSSFTFKDSPADVVEIGQALGVSNVLEGSVRKEGDSVRISVQLIDAATGFQLWSDSFDRQLTSVFQVQNEISRRIADALQLTLLPMSVESSGTGEPALSPAVLDEYLLGLEALRVSSFDALQRAVAHFSAALDRDPTFDAARVQLAATKIQQLNTGATDDRSLVAEAESLVKAALEARPDDAAAHRVYGLVLKWQSQWGEARRQFETALELAPSDVEAMVSLAHALAGSGELAAARRLIDRALRFDPFSTSLLHTHAYIERQFGAIDAARVAMERAVELQPENPNTHWMYGQVLAGEFGDLAGALQAFLLSAERDPSDYEIAAYVAAGYLALEMPDAAAPWVERAAELGPENAITTLSARAVLELVSGDLNAARETARLGVEHRGDRFMGHAFLTAPVVTIVAGEATEPERAARVVEFMDAERPGAVDYAGKFSEKTLEMESLISASDLPRRWLVEVAAVYAASGSPDRARQALQRLEGGRIDTIAGMRDALRGEDYYVEAAIRAVEGDVDGAFAMLDEAVDRNVLFLWQVYYENNVAFDGLRRDPRWPALMDRIQQKVAVERQLVAAALAMAAARRQSSDGIPGSNLGAGRN